METNRLLSKAKTSELLIHAKAHQFSKVAQIIHDHSGLTQSSILQLIENHDGNEFLYLIKALDLKFPADLQLILALRPELGRNYPDYRKAKNLFVDLEVGICRLIFNEIGANFEISRNTTTIKDKPAPADDTQYHYVSSVRHRRENLAAETSGTASVNTKEQAKQLQYA